LLPRAPIDLMPLPSSEKLNFDCKQRAELMLKMHETTKENIERMNANYKISGDKGRKQLDFEPGDLVWLYLRKERFSNLRKSKLKPRVDGPFKVLKKINENAYKLDLPADFGVSPTFNIIHFKPRMSLSRGRLKCKKGRRMWTSTPKIHPHLHIIRFLVQLQDSCALTKQSGILVPNFLIILFRQWKYVFCFVA
jgi:hypothetical protein